MKGEINSVLIPGKNGDFEIMNNHVAIVSSLVAGKVTTLHFCNCRMNIPNFLHEEKENESVSSFRVKSGVIEFNHNKGTILAEYFI
ncbi:FoF1 ATP synthase subunit delta/epsilon [Halpernia sp. GG3]